LSLILECLERLGAQDIRETPEGYECQCPFHRGSKRNFRVAHTSTKVGKNFGRPGAWRCHMESCRGHQGGYLESLVMEAFHVPFNEAAGMVKERGTFYRRIEEPPQDDVNPAEVYPYIGVPCPYLLERGFLQHDLDRYRIGYKKATDEIIIPTFDEYGNLVGITRRKARPGQIYYHSRFKKSSYVWGLDLVEGSCLTITEGQLDPVGLAPHWDAPGVAQMGSSLSQRQAELICERVETVYLAFDNDSAGVMATFTAIERLRAEGLTDLYILTYTASDPGALTREGGEVTNVQRSNRWIAEHL